ncbi:MAG TPA: SpoIIE family protein phosphatase [Bryobacteraceae bacterium]|nr:SpoIIE family protein phosphatase [Bryobacteraceae bacterium]
MAPARARELRIHGPDGQAKIVPLVGDHLTLGRSSTAELCFADDAGLSRQHLSFERDGEDWNIRDLGSKNGTLLNNVRLTGAMRLRSGDRIAAGHLMIVYDDPGRNAIAAGVTFVQGAGEGESTTSSTVVFDPRGFMGAKGKSTGVSTMESSSLAMSALIKAGNELGPHNKKPLPELFELILNLSIEAVGAERGVLMTVENDGELMVRAAKGTAFRISTAVRDRVLNEQVSVLVRDTQLDDAFKARQSIVGQRVRTLIAVPLQTKDRIIGLIYVDSPSLTRVFTKDDLNLLTVMANTAATRIEHERLAEIEHQERILARDLQQAADIQQGFLPATAPSVPGLDLAGHNAPCRTVGGDYYDFFPYPNGRVAMVLGDVSGKGMPASLLMMSLQAYVQVLIEEPGDLGAVMTRLNRMTSTNCPSNRFITFFMCVVNGSTGELLFSNAGHNPPLLMRADGKAEWLEAGGCPLGIMASMQYEESRNQLCPGDVLVVFSDGVTDANDPTEKEFGEERLANVVRDLRHENSAAILDGINRAIADWSAGTPLPDDLTLVIARRAG